jgi:glycosyltransferase family protein
MDFRKGKFFKIPRKIIKYLLSLYYHVVILAWKFPQVKSIDETLNVILTKNCSVSRFGDGELSIIVDKASYPFQKYDELLAKRLSEILKSRHPDILICLPVGFESLHNLTPSIKRAWKAHVALIYPRLVRHLDITKTYYNASMTRPYISYKDKSISKNYFQRIMQIWAGRDVILIEGEKSRLGVNNDLFHQAHSFRRVLAPMHNAFEKYNEIMSVAKTYNKSALILIALGPTATVLAFDLGLEGFQAIDIGNVDIEYEWYRMGVNKKVKVKGKYTSEVAGGTIVEDVLDQEYRKQIDKILI